MIELVSSEEAKLHLRIDDDYGDSNLILKIQDSGAVILSYTQGGRTLVVDNSGRLTSGEPFIRVQIVLLVLLDYLDRNRGGEEEDKLKQGEPPFSVSMPIYDLHKPTITWGTGMARAGYAGRCEWIKKWTRIVYEQAVGERTNSDTESAGNVPTETDRSDRPLGSD